MRDRFEEIYRTREWGKGSGEGSSPRHTRGYVAMLQRFLRENNIRSVIDLGCGDWQFSRFIDWSGIQYHGYDLVGEIIKQNQRRYSRSGIQFHLFSGNLADLPQADLLIAKDLLQHWSNQCILDFLPTLSRYPKALITNCVNPRGTTQNSDISVGEFRYLDIRLPPFNLQAQETFCFTNHTPAWLRPFVPVRWLKKVLLVQNPNPPSP
jgi:2-polyprenyl-3-methyl-5-hydroxy-6-metoxy-1,4-benzoquinol methylase